MRKLIDVGRIKRILAVLVVIALLLNIPLLTPIPTRAESDVSSGQSTAELYEGIPNGTVMEDGNVLLYYSLWDFEARYKNALYYDNFFDPAIIPLPFETDEARETFLAGYRGDTWYLLDVVYSTRLMPAPGSNPSEEEIEALMAASSFAYVVKSKESGLVRVILSTKNGEEFKIHIEADEDGEALSATLVLFEEEVTVTEIEEEEAIEEDVQEEDSVVEEDAAEEDAAAEEEKNPAVSEEKAEEKTPAIDEAAPAENPAAGENKAEEESPAAGEDANENNNANTEESAAPSGETPAAPPEGSQGEPAPSGESSASESGIVSALRSFFTATIYAADADDSTEESPADDPAAPVMPDASAEESAAPEAPTDDESAPGKSTDAASEEFDDAATEETAPAGESDEIKQVIVEVSLNEIKEVLAGFADALEEIIEARPLAALEITTQQFAASKNADVSNALFGEQSGGLGDALKSAFSSMSASEVYGAEGDDIRYFPVNLYNYMGTLDGTVSENHFNLNYNNFNTPAVLSQALTVNGPDEYNNISLKRYFLFNQTQIRTSLGAWQAYAVNNNPNKHGDQNRGTKTNLPGVKQGIAKPMLGNDGTFEINFATMNGLGLFPKITSSLQENTQVYIYGNNTPGGNQLPSQNGQNPGMIQAYPNYLLPFVKEGGGYYSFDSSRERVYVQGAGKELKRADYVSNNAKKGFFPFYSGTELTGDPTAAYYNFGMSAELDFVIPKDGKVNDEDMVFEFAGDDDIWVYIDGRLVLDIGGIHAAEDGTINFAEKTVTVKVNQAGDAVRKLDTETSGYYPGTSTLLALTNGSVTKSFSEIITDYEETSFGEYTSHKLQIFYMDRAPASSNCKIRFNIPVIEQDKLNVLKFADTGTDVAETFGFEVYGATGSGEPTDENGGDLIATSDSSKNEYNPSLEIKKDGRFALDIPQGYTWVRVVEMPKPIAPGSDEDTYSTVFLGKEINKSDKNSGWIQVDENANDKTNVLFCVNYTQHPITLTKYKLDDMTRTPGEMPQDNDKIEYGKVSDVEFKLYEADINNEPIAESEETVITNLEGQIIFNDPRDDTTPELEQGKTYILIEQKQENYEQAPDIYFKTTQGVSPLVDEIWYYDAADTGKDNPISYKKDDEDKGYGKIVFASESGRDIRLYNKRLTGSVTVNKTLTNIEDVNFAAQGNPIFLFKLEKSKDDSFDDIIGTQTAHAEFPDTSSGPEPAKFNDLEAGYYYRISELNTMRYTPDQESLASLTGTSDTDGTGNNTVTFELTDALVSNSVEIIANFTNKRTYADYLSDTAAAVNSFTYTPPWPEASAPVVYRVNITKTGEPGYSVTRYITDGGHIDISKGTANGIGDKINPAQGGNNQGAIGKVKGTTEFYPHTPIKPEFVDSTGSDGIGVINLILY
ncbi:MAG: fibro-slime domain-containing protein [Clostridiales Family XIII bacterium]|nr:fibro-slime domain-containing protein [Clostridiales Family XIII bacterium]